jgi:hypothetical protein
VTSATQKLTALVDAPDRFDRTSRELRETQLSALDERFQERKERIRLLGHRAGEAGITAVRSHQDLLPLLFPHSVYKSYPESFLTQGRWDRLTAWLSTVSPHPVTAVQTDDITDIDDWIERLGSRGHYVSCSSGTTGKSAMLLASAKDMDWSRKDTVNVFSWGSGVRPGRDRRMIGIAPTAAAPRNKAIGEAQEQAFGDPAKKRFRLPIAPITVGTLTQTILLRKKIADGRARPEELARFERTSAARQKELTEAMNAAAEALVSHRAEKLYISGMWSALHQVAVLVRELGYSGKDFHPDNCLYVAGGLKRAQLPGDYKAFVHETFGIPSGHDFQNYSMQELGSGMPKCREGNRYHVPPWVVPLVLDETGENLLTHTSGEVQGRAAFFDLSLDGRWGGVITGDRISLDLDPCACGSRGPSIRNDIVRYADLSGDDKIGCAGTVDAYVRGVS